MKKKANSSKNNRKKEKNKIEEVGSFDADLSKVIYIIVGVLVVFGLFYLITLFVLDRDTSSKVETPEAEISLDTTIVGRSLSMPEKKYYVLFYDNDNEEVSEEYSSIITDYTYSTDDSRVKLYTVDMSDGLNKNFVKEESNSNPEKASDIAIKGTTLMVIEEGKVVDYIEDQTRIKDLLK